MDERYYSLKEIAEMLNLSKQKVYRCVKSNHIMKHHDEVVNGNVVMMYSESAYLQVKDILGETVKNTDDTYITDVHQKQSETLESVIIDILREQSDFKDDRIKSLEEQLKAKDAQIASLQRMNEQFQELHAIDVRRVREVEEDRNILLARRRNSDVQDKEPESQQSQTKWKLFGRR